MIGAHP